MKITTHTSVEDVSELMDINITRIDAVQDHWRAADERFKTVFETNTFGLSCSVCDRLWYDRDLKKLVAFFFFRLNSPAKM